MQTNWRLPSVIHLNPLNCWPTSDQTDRKDPLAYIISNLINAGKSRHKILLQNISLVISLCWESRLLERCTRPYKLKDLLRVLHIFFISVGKNWKLWAKFTANAHPLSSVSLEMGGLQLTAPLKCHRLPLDCMFGVERQRMERRRHTLARAPADHISDSM